MENRGQTTFYSVNCSYFSNRNVVCPLFSAHHMVRNIAGVLMTIGCGEQPPEWAHTVLEARDRTVGGVTASADGLYLCSVDYPTAYVFPKVDKLTEQAIRSMFTYR